MRSIGGVSPILAALMGATAVSTTMDIEKERRKWEHETRRPNRMSQKKRRQRARWTRK